MKQPYTVSLDTTVAEKAKKVAGLVPFSRYIEDLLRKDIEAKEVTRSGQGGKI